MKNNYDKIARYYDTLSRLVFFRAQLNAQIALLKDIPVDSNLLIVGGGTGWILEEIAKIHASGLTITYVEISEKMLGLSRKRDVKQNHVRFVQAAIADYATEESFDVIITAFLFDNFSGDAAVAVFEQLHRYLKAFGLWLFTDFYYTQNTGKFWQGWLLQTMYFFFRRISDVEADKLVDMEPLFKRAGYTIRKTQYTYQRFIKSLVYLKH
jgi:ubiquinone/menaquinone biosynthesis C-methylase UbiE